MIEINQQLEKSISLLQATLDATADGILVLDNNDRVINYNQKFAEIWELAPTLKIHDEQILNLIGAKLAEPYRTNLKATPTQFARQNYDFLELKNGKILECYSQAQQFQNQAGRVWSFRDVTQHKQAQALIQYQAFHDPLTDLPNRAFFDRRIG